MGLFSRTKSRSSSQHRDCSSSTEEENIYVFVRTSEPSSSSSSSSSSSLVGKVTWSLAVSRTTRGVVAGSQQQQQQQQQQSKPRKSVFSFSSRNSSHCDDVVDRQQSQSKSPLDSTPPNPVFHEFALSAEGGAGEGYLQILHHPRPTPTLTPTPTNSDSDSDSDSDSSSSFLLQILLPRPSSPQPHHTSHHHLSHLLRQTTSPNPRNSETWVRSALLTLQHSRHIPSPPVFNVDKFMDFARNAFEGEVLLQRPDQPRGGEAGLGAKYVKAVDYAAHVRENERLKALFGHGEEEDVGAGEKEWRVGWGCGVRRERDPYAGLM